MILCNNNLLHEINGKIERMSQVNERKKNGNLYAMNVFCRLPTEKITPNGLNVHKEYQKNEKKMKHA